jgi:hypothetical protein
MTTIFDAPSQTGQPATHVIIIGVSDYPYLPGGSEHPAQAAHMTFGLRSLTSPTRSAAAMADWILHQTTMPVAPLGSVELVMSPGDYTPSDSAAATLGVASGTVQSVELATLANIKAAVNRWFARVNQHVDNVALFYFCGHGLEATDRYLLASDFGANLSDWTVNIINFTQFKARVERGKAKGQCFFVDACRDTSADLSDEAKMQTVGDDLLGPQPRSAAKRDILVVQASRAGESAQAPPGEESYFTRGLLNCLEGMGAGDPAGAVAWIDTESLGSAIREMMDRIGEREGMDLSCDVDPKPQLPQPVELFQVNMPVQVMTIVTCLPARAHGIADLAVTDSLGAVLPRVLYESRPWRIELPSGICSFAVSFAPTDAYQGDTISGVVRQPIYRARLPVALRQSAVGGPTGGRTGA